ncbi:MAG: TylF/MycF family methyltransferase [Vicinamibacterales bacterium]|nr:TylF/MycF family methyltransferase [Vicinamibacterales bacterium]
MGTCGAARADTDMLAESPLATLYLDLLEQTLTGAILQDTGVLPAFLSTTVVASVGYDRERRSKGRDWPTHAHTMIGLERLRSLRHLVAEVLENGTSGDLLEAGVWRGGASIYMRALLAAHGVNDRRVWVVDSFAGLPPPNEKDFPADRGDRLHEIGYLAVPLEEVKQNFQKYGMLDSQVEFVSGWFKDTLPTIPVSQLAILRLDGDMYESTTQCLRSLYGRVSIGGFVIIDDFGLPPCRQAVEDFREQNGIVDPLIDIDGMAVFWQRAGP